MAETVTLVLVDYLVVGAMLCISVGIGIYYRFTGGHQETTEEYFQANKSMSIGTIGIALMVSFMSAVTLLGLSAENYTYGTQFMVINLSYLIGTPIVAYGYLPVFFKLQGTSVYQYLEKRFGSETRLIVSFVNWLQLLLYTGVVLYAPSLALEATTGLSKTGSVIIIGLVCAFYSSIGGIKAVLITDVVQAVLMFASIFIVIGTAAYSIGGLGEIWNIAQQGGRIDFDNISADLTVRHTWWSLTIGGLCTFLSLYGVNQIQVQRMLTVRDLKSAQNALWLSYPILVLLSVSTCFSGLAIYSKYYNCDPISKGRITSIDMLMPLYIMDTLSGFPGLPGLFVAGIFSAGLSTISAALNSLAAITLEDYIKPLYAKCGYEFPISRSIIFGKILAFLFGLTCIALAFLSQFLGSILQASLTIFGVVGGPVLGIFTLGMATESATQRGAVTGVVTALAFLLWIAFGQPRPMPPKLPVSIDGCNATAFTNVTLSVARNITESMNMQKTDDSSYFYLYRISYMWYCPLGFLITFVVGLVVSNLIRGIFNEKKKELHQDLFISFVGNRISRRQRLSQKC